MYQAQITKNGQPVTNTHAIDFIASVLGNGTYEYDREMGCWMVDLNRYREERLERDGFLSMRLGWYAIEIDLP